MKTHDLIFRGYLVPDISEYQYGAIVLVECTTREYHSTVVELEDLGWEVRDCLKVLSSDPSFSHHFALLRKPFKGSVVQNVLTHQTGGLNIDGCRVPLSGGEQPKGSGNAQKDTLTHGDRKALEGGSITPAEGRFPANLILHQIEDILSQFPEGHHRIGSAARFFQQFSSRSELNDYLLTLIRPEADAP